MIWRKIKKIYFKIYHLFKLIGIFILVLIPSIVKAEVNECWTNMLVSETITIDNYNTNSKRIRPTISIGQDFIKNKTYYVRFYPENKYICPSGTNCFTGIFWTSNSQNLVPTYTMNWREEKQILEVTIQANSIYYMAIIIRTNETTNNLAGYPMLIGESLEEIKNCTKEPIPEPSNNVISEFTSVYTDRLSYLGTETMNNEYMLAFIGIIIGFIVLEIFLRIFHIRGGYKK